MKEPESLLEDMDFIRWYFSSHNEIVKRLKQAGALEEAIFLPSDMSLMADIERR